MFKDVLVVVKGAGDLATGVGLRLFRSGFPLVMTEIAEPTVVRRPVSFAEAVYDGETSVEGVIAKAIPSVEQVYPTIREGKIPVIVDPEARVVTLLRPKVVVDAIIAKRNVGTKITDAPVVIGLGPGFTAGVDVHAVVETNRGHYLGRVILEGSAEPNTGVPGVVGGYGVERVLRGPGDGKLVPILTIGQFVRKGDLIARVDGQPVLAPIDGVLRGLVRENVTVFKGMKIGDVDPRAAHEHCFTVSDKALSIGGGVLEVILMHLYGARRTSAGV
ncbi:MAG: selenium-dependent molybdenum cofactor biosynthesis protein YqeB [Chloroflexi bacterium]|nr:selenium-dependent molybdenum cofactor biosynthesis protein YqeB [Chloroflexota bacterium]